MYAVQLIGIPASPFIKALFLGAGFTIKMIYEKGRKSNRNIEPLRFVVVSGLCLREFQKKRPDWEVRQMGFGDLWE